MPLRRRNARRKFSRRRRIGRARRFTRRVVGAVAKMAEKKHIITHLGTITIPVGLTNAAGSYFNPLETLQQGAGVNQRVGNRAYIRKSKYRFVITYNFTRGANEPTSVNFGYRIIVGWYKNWNYVNANIWEDTGLTAADRWLAPIDSDKFFVKKDKIYTLTNGFNNLTLPMWRQHTLRIRWNKQCQWNDNLASATSQSWLPAIVIIPHTSAGGTLADRLNDYLSWGTCITTFTDL